jgi:signal transduction histidine kinase
MSREAKLWLWGIVALLCLQTLASTIFQGYAQVAVSDLTQLFLLLSGTLALLPLVKKSYGRARMFWALMALGTGFWCFYQALWCYYEVVLRQEVPNLFAGDIVLFVHLVPMIAAMAVQPHLQQDQRHTRLGSLDFIMLLIWWLYLYVIALVPWQHVNPDANIYQHNLNAIYSVEKAVLLASLCAIWFRSSGFWRQVYANWLGCVLLYSLISYLANWAIEQKLYFTGSVYDVPLAVSMAWVTWIGLQAARATAEEKPKPGNNGHGVWVARLGMIAVLSLPLFAAWAMFDRSTPESVRIFRLEVSLCAMLALGGMVFLKQHMLDLELLSLVKTSQEAFENLKRLQAQVVQSEKLASLGQLVGGAAHELNNPLTAMIGYTELLGLTTLSSEQKSLVQKMEQQLRRTRTLVSSLLSFAKQVPAEKSPIDVNALLQTAVRLRPPQHHGGFVQIQTNLGSNLPRVLGDSNQLLQVCLHITNNAAHAMSGKGGVLNVCTRSQNGFVVIEFTDDGPGIDKPERVFDPFYTTRPVGQGAGLGLSVCYGVIQEHKGRITCQNRPEGGAMFRIELPALIDAAGQENVATQAHSEAKAAATN